MKTKHTIILGDSRRMAEVSDQSVHLIVTSPPYWQLKDYGHPDQIGYNDTYEEYVNNLNLVWNECFRVLRPGCRLCINVGDQFARSVYYGRYKVIPIRTEIIKFCETIGFDYIGAIIWQKVTTTNTTGGGVVMGSYPHPRNGIVKVDYEFVLLFKKLGSPPKPTKEQKKKSKLTRSEWSKYFSGHWNFAGEKQNGHLAKYPEELPRRLIKMFSFVGETALDPFLGSGTTSLAALHLNRNSIGYEINRAFSSAIRKKLKISTTAAFPVAHTFEMIQQEPREVNFTESISALPYVFHDPVRFTNNADARRLRFGSRIDGREKPHSPVYSVKRIESPEYVELSSGLRIRLLGIKTIPDKAGEAVNFLNKMTRNQKVYVKFDALRHDDENTTLGYLYLKNKTFINAHLIKHGLAEVDQSSEYRWKRKFLQYTKLDEAR